MKEIAFKKVVLIQFLRVVWINETWFPLHFYTYLTILSI